MNVAFHDLDPKHRELLERALEARGRAYAPYSHFLVGSAVRTATGALLSGCNVENASYGLSICAEISALTAAVSAGDPRVLSIAVIGGDRHEPAGIVAPCGRCRQWIAEFAVIAATDIVVLMADVSLASVRSCLISELLPSAFSLPGGEHPGS